MKPESAGDALFHDPALSFEANTDITIAMGKELKAVEVLTDENVRTWALDWIRNKIFRDQHVDAIVSLTIGWSESCKTMA